MENKKKWFECWFDSPFYHILYKDRDNKEAAYFIDNLVENLELAQGAKILDLACGKGRHSIYLNRKGFQVTGVDLSFANIAAARRFKNEHLRFDVHDMRLPYKYDRYDMVLNLFTSLGYFEDEEDNFLVVQSAAKGLKKQGFLIIDFMNVKKVMKSLKKDESKSVDGIHFSIKRTINDSFIEKDINFTADNFEHHFQEKVKLLTLQDFMNYLSLCGLKVVELFGDYWLNKFDENTSDRLIIKAIKN